MTGTPVHSPVSLAPSRARVAILLSVLLLFFGVALFSPLHKHTLSKSGNSCSFNDLEHQLISLAEAAVVLAPLDLLLEPNRETAPDSPFTRDTRRTPARAPPALS